MSALGTPVDLKFHGELLRGEIEMSLPENNGWVQFTVE